MFSAANEYIDGELKRRVLDPFVESYDTDTSETRSGLLGGEASLQNLVLKKRRWVFGQLVLSLEYGRMESLALNFPWLTSKTFSVCRCAVMVPCLLPCSFSRWPSLIPPPSSLLPPPSLSRRALQDNRPTASTLCSTCVLARTKTTWTMM